MAGHEEQPGPEHTSVSQTVNNPGNLDEKKDKLVEAESTHERALQGNDETLSPNHMPYDEVEGEQNHRTEAHSNNPESMQTRPLTDSGYGSAANNKFKSAHNAQVESHKRSTGDIRFQPPIDKGFTPTISYTTEEAWDLKNLEADEVGTVYSDTSSLPAFEEETYISALADDLFSKAGSEQHDDQIIRRISETLPGLLQAFALKVGYSAPTQKHRDVMFFVHKYRR